MSTSRHALVLLLAACGPEDADEPPFDLAHGVTVDVTADGALRLTRTVDDTPLLATSPLRLRRVDEAWTAPTGIWTFQRSILSERTADAVEGLAFDGEAITAQLVADGATVGLRITGQGHRTDVVLTPSPTDSLVVPVSCDEESSFHGFGGQYHHTDHRGEAFDLFVSEQGIGRTGADRILDGDDHTVYFPMPWYLDAGRGFGVLLDTEHRTLVDACATDPTQATLEVTSDRPLTVHVFDGPTPLEVVQQLSDHLGRPPEPPAWAWQPWLAAQGGREAVEEEVADLLAADIPVGAIWSQDWTGIRRNFSGGFGVEYRWVADDQLYPDLPGFIDDLHAQDIRFLGYANPFVDVALDDHWPDMVDQGLLVEDPDGEPYVFLAPNGQSGHPDFTAPGTAAYIEGYLRDKEAMGFDGWMVDFGEWTPLDAVLADGSDPAAYHNRFPLLWQQVTRDVMETARPDGDWVSFARSGWTGSQAIQQIHWIGDQEADWSETDGLPTVVPAMLHLGLAGVMVVTHDIAGFSGGPSSKELFQRWTELGAFTPIMRTHDGDDKLDNWRWDSDPETTAHFRRFARIHAALADELATLAAEAAATGTPMVRHLMLAWPEDPVAADTSDQFLLGDLLVAPVVTEGARRREVYLPEGTWFHVWTGDAYTGPATVTVDAPIGSPPVFSPTDRADLRAIE